MQRLFLFFIASVAFGLGLVLDVLSWKMAAIILLVFTVFIITFVPGKWAIAIYFVYLGIEGFLKIVSDYYPLIHVGADVLVIALIFKAVGTVILKGGRLPAKLPPFSVPIMIHYLWVFIVFFNPYSYSLIATIAGSKIYIIPLTLFFFGYFLSDSKESIRLFMMTWVIIGLAQLVSSLMQSSIGPASVTDFHPRYAQALYKYRYTAFRPFGLTAVPGYPAVFIYIVAPFIFYFILNARSYLIKALLIASVPLFGITLFLCQIRSALLKSMISSTVFLGMSLFGMRTPTVQMRIAKLALGVATVALLAFTLPNLMKFATGAYEGNEEAIGRTMTLFEWDKVKTARDPATIWRRFKKFAVMVPFGAGLARLGAGGAQFKSELKQHYFNPDFFADNFWLHTLIELGIPGMAIMTGILLSILGRGVYYLRKIRDPQLQSMQGAILATIFASIIGLYGYEGILFNPESSFFWFFSGTMMRLPELDSQQTPPT